VVGGIQGIPKIPQLRVKLLWTMFYLAIYRMGVAVPTPGVDNAALEEYFSRMSGTLFGMINMFSGGALQRFSVFALGIMPYITASIIISLLTVVFPYFENLQKEGELGRRKITQITRYATVLLATIHGTMLAIGLEKISTNGVPLVLNPGMGFRLMTVITLVAGTAFIMWLGERITEKGISNGISIIIFSGIVVNLPSSVLSTFRDVFQTGRIKPLEFLLIVVIVAISIGVIILFERAQRRIPVQYPKRMVGRKMYAGQSSHLPLRLNSAGVIPPIFASSLLMFPSTIANLKFTEATFWDILKDALNMTSWSYHAIYIPLIIFFTFFYTAITFRPDDVAENLKKHGGFVPGIRPGAKTSEFIERVLARITVVGAIYLATVCVLPSLLIVKFNVSFFFGGTSLLIVVGVALDMLQKIETELIARHYDTFIKGARIRGRRSTT